MANSMHSKWTMCGALALAAAALVPAAQAEGAAGWRDPFKRPQRPVVAGAPASAADASPQPQLRAVIYDRVRPLVDIDGRILALGESVNGYRLVRVGEREAVLSRQGRQIRLQLDRMEPR